MAYDTKVLLIAIAEHAVALNSKNMYKFIAKMANAEGVVLQTYEEAKSEQESDKDEKHL